MTVFLIGIGILVLGGLVVRRAESAVVGCAVGLAGTVLGTPSSLRLPWQIPYASFYVEIDALSAFFLVPIFVLCGLAAVYGAGYLRKPSRGHWFHYHLLVAGMALVVVARNGVLFLVAWEVMSLAAFFLVTHDDEKPEVREAGWTYLVATHLGTAFLLAFFVLMGRGSASLDFDLLRAHHANLLFVLAVIGFGTKAGFMPLHVWLPEAHPAAPSHVSAVLSGVMIKTGIYGLLRALTMLGAPPAWWGWLLVVVGSASGIAGILFAVAQRELKRLLAYSSVENVGIITLAIGLGILGVHAGSAALATLAFAGALLHVLNHSLFKGLLFLGAGSILHGTGTANLDRLGGLMKKMRNTGVLFAVGAVAICGLPPLNGFVGEFVIYLAALRSGSIAAYVAIGALSIIGGLALVAFTKAFGAAFLGEPRSSLEAHEANRSMRLPMILLAASCVGVAAGAPWLVRAMGPAVGALGGAPYAELASAGRALGRVTLVSGAFVGILALLVILRRRMLARRTVGETGTWDCGYAAPAASMQYTSSSFAQPVTAMAPLGTRATVKRPEGIFPRSAELSTSTPDACRERLFAPAFFGIGWLLHRLRWLQHGRVHLYVLYIMLTLMALLIWKLS